MKKLANCICVAALFCCQAALADKPAPPRDYAVEAEGGEYVFVMLAPDGFRANESLREKWSQSGLYGAHDPDHPLWSVDWYAFSVIAGSDGHHLVRRGPWAKSTDDLAVAFYEDGHELNHYHIRELIADESRLRRSVSHFEWSTDWNYDDDAGLLTIETVDGQHHRFSVADGKLLGND